MTSRWLIITFLMTLVFTNLLPAQETGEKHLVLIGVQDHQDPSIPDLNYCVKDVEAVEKVFKDPELCVYERRRVITLHTSQKNKVDLPTLDNIRAELRRTLSRAQKDDLVIVYFSGHGVVDGKGNGYLIPSDCKRDEVLTTALPVSELVEMFKDCPATKRMLVLDCCHAGAGGKRLTIEKTETPFKQPGAATLAEEFNKELPQVVTLASCKSDEISYEWAAKKQGYFTWFLLEALQGGFADSDENSVISSTELAAYLEGRVKAQVKKDKGNRVNQTPVLVVSKPGAVPSIPLARATFQPFTLTLKGQQNGLPPKDCEGKLIVKDGVLIPDLGDSGKEGENKNYFLALPTLGVRKSFVINMNFNLGANSDNSVGLSLIPKGGRPWHLSLHSRGGLDVNRRRVVPKFGWLQGLKHQLELVRIVSERGSTVEVRVDGNLLDSTRIDSRSIPKIVLGIYYGARGNPGITSFSVRPYQPKN